MAGGGESRQQIGVERGVATHRKPLQQRQHAQRLCVSAPYAQLRPRHVHQPLLRNQRHARRCRIDKRRFDKSELLHCLAYFVHRRYQHRGVGSDADHRLGYPGRATSSLAQHTDHQRDGRRRVQRISGGQQAARNGGADNQKLHRALQRLCCIL